MSLKIQRTPTMIGRHLAAIGTALGMLAVFASPAMANVLQTAQVFVSANCNSYTITVTGTELDSPNAFVSYSFTVSPTNQTTTGSIPVTPNDQAGDFSASQKLGFPQLAPGGECYRVRQCYLPITATPNSIPFRLLSRF
jgi:hypothetical protein